MNPVYSITYSSLKLNAGPSLVAQWLRLFFHCRSTSSITDLGTKILCAIQHGQKKEKKQESTTKTTLWGCLLYLAEIAISKQVGCYPWKHKRPHFLPYSYTVRYGYVGHFIANRAGMEVGDSFLELACVLCVLSHLSHVLLFVTPWTGALQAPLSMGFSRQESSNGLPNPPPENLPNPRTEPTSLMSPTLAGSFFTTGITWEAQTCPIIMPNISSTPPFFPPVSARCPCLKWCASFTWMMNETGFLF